MQPRSDCSPPPDVRVRRAASGTHQPLPLKYPGAEGREAGASVRPSTRRLSDERGPARAITPDLDQAAVFAELVALGASVRGRPHDARRSTRAPERMDLGLLASCPR